MKLWTVCFACLIVLMALAPNTSPFYGAPGAPAATATPQVTMNPFAVVQGQDATNPIDMGPTPDTFVKNVDWNREPAPTSTGNYCGTTGAPNCTTFKYVDQIRNFCKTVQPLQVLADSGLPGPGGGVAAGETWFNHYATSPPTPAAPRTPFREVVSDPNPPPGQPVPTPTPSCDPYYYQQNYPTSPPAGQPAPISVYPFEMNVDDPGFQAELQTCCWTNTDSNHYPQVQNATTAPMNVYEDNSGITGRFITGDSGPSLPFASEYGCWWGSPPGQTCRIDLVGTNPSHVADDWDTALGKWANAACGGTCLKITFNGGDISANITPSCNIWNGTQDCHDQIYTGYIDNTFETSIAKAINANTSNNIVAFDFESPFFNHKTPFVWAQPATIVLTINTWINLQQDANTKSVYFTDLEPGNGSLTNGKCGDTSVDVRTFAIAAEWLAPDYSGTASSNDRIVPRRLPIGCTQTESPSLFELFLVPFAPENVVSPYVMHNDSTQTTTTGGGCPNTGGDKGGIISLLAQCATGDSGGVYILQYKQLWFNGHNYGPMAVLLNTSSTDTITIQSSWFKGESLASYGFALALTGTEMESVAQGNIGGGVANFTTCTNITYCSATNNTMALNTTAVIPTTIGPHSAVILVTTNS